MPFKINNMNGSDIFTEIVHVVIELINGVIN